MTSSILNELAGALLFVAGVADLWFEAWAAEGFQRSAASLVAFAGLVFIVRGAVVMEPSLRARSATAGRDARSAG